MSNENIFQVVSPSRFVTVDLFNKLTGLTKKAVYCKISNGIWAEGVHFRRRDGRIFIDMECYEKWVDVAAV